MMQHLRALHPADGDGAADLGLVSLVSGFSLILILVAAAQLLDLNLSTTITIAAVRTVLQLLALGCILQPIFDHNEPYVVLPYVLAMACFAARESGARPTFVYPSLGWHVLLALLNDDRCGRAVLRDAAPDLSQQTLRAAMDQVRGNRRIDSRTPEGTYEALEKYSHACEDYELALRIDPKDPCRVRQRLNRCRALE